MFLDPEWSLFSFFILAGRGGRGRDSGLRGYLEVMAEVGDGLKGMAKLECPKR